MKIAMLTLLCVAAAALAACNTDRGIGETGTVGVAPPPQAADMNGRWVLSSTAGGVCAMNFSSAGASEGTIRPEGGCPGKFFTSRKWTYEGNSLVIRNHNSEPLGQLSTVAPSRFEGQMAAGGTPISLVR
jgi:hypothetical protein